MVLPSSHSPPKWDHAMRAALREPGRGEIPMKDKADIRFVYSRSDLLLPRQVSSVRGVEDKY